MYFPASEIEVCPLIPVAAAFAISFFSSMGGISGAFLLLPFQMSALHVSVPSVSGTNQFYNLVAIPAGVWRYMREGRMLWPLAIAIALGTLPGVFFGALIRVIWLPEAGPFKIFAALVLLFIGGTLGRGVLREDPARAGTGGEFRVRVEEFSPRRIAYTFQGVVYSCPTPGIIAMTLVIGMVGGIYGIGGGAFTSPLLIVLFGLPVHTIAGATLMGTFLTSVAGVIIYTALGPFFPGVSVTPDWLLGLFLGLGGAAGLYLGARAQKHVPSRLIKAGLVVIILGIACKYLFDALG